MRLYRVTAHSPDVRTFSLPFADVWVADSIDPNDDVGRATIIAAAQIDLTAITDLLVERLGLLPRIEYAVTELPSGPRNERVTVVLKRGVPINQGTTGR